jgi:phage shock protein A
MGLFARLARLIKSNINALITSAEDPEKMLHQLINDMAEQLGDARKQVAAAMADEKRLARQVEAQVTSSEDWEKKAMLAVRAGNDALAKEALARRKEHDSLAAQYREQWQKQKQGVDQLKLALRALNNKIEEAKRKKGMLIARQKRAEAQKAIHETLSGMKSASAFEAFDEMAGRIEQLESEAEVSMEMAAEYTGDNLTNQFAALEAEAGGDNELLALKQKMGLAPAPAPALPQKPAVATTGIRVDPGLAELDVDEQQELAEALAQLEAEERSLEGKR